MIDILTKYEDLCRVIEPPEPVNPAPITPEQLIYLAGGPPPEVQWGLNKPKP